MSISGPPEPPGNIKAVSVAAYNVNITWVVGGNRGSQQTFLVMFRKTGESQPLNFKTNAVDPVAGTVEYFVLSDLTPETEYEIWVRSENQNTGDNHADSEKITVVTRGKQWVFKTIYTFTERLNI